MNDFNFSQTVGIVAGVVSLVAFIPYIASIVRGNTKPSRATWFILSLTSVITLVSYSEAVDGSAIWIIKGAVAATVVTFLLSIKYGVGGWERFDRLALIGCAVTLGLWAFYRSAELALIAILLTDLIGLLPTIKKTYYHPEQENSLAWILTYVASVLSLLTLFVDGWSLINAAYPAYLAVSSGAIAILSFQKKHVLPT